MAAPPQAFYCLWQEERIRESLFDLLHKEDICAVRLASSACCNVVTRRLFMRTHLTFTASTFTKPCRVQALSRIGHHIEHLTFHLAHSEATFLPPLIHPESGREISFLYTPHTSMSSVLARPKYANSELGDILTQQYPPLFHAATNVPSFINAMKHLPNMRHLSIQCPGQDPQERYRRDVVDYALISLRIAVERAPLLKLSKLTLSRVHPAAFTYLRPVPGFGSLPSAGRRWRQIRKLHIGVESWDFYGASPGLDQLKIMDDYIRHFAPSLEKLTVAWLGRKGPCLLALGGDPLFAPPRSARKLFNEVTSPMSPLPERPPRAPLVLPRLRSMAVCNATMNAAQVAELVAAHRPTAREFDFEDVALVGRGSWEEALAPLTEESHGGHDVWAQSPSSSRRPVLCRGSDRRVGGGGCSAAASEASFQTATATASTDDFEIHSPSAAVAAASRELLDLDVEDLEAFVGLRDGSEGSAVESILEEEEEAEEQDQDQDQDHRQVDDLASEIAAAREASMSFSTKLRKRRIRRRHRKYTQDGEMVSADEGHGHVHHDSPKRSGELTRQRSQPASHCRRPHRHRRHHSDEGPSPSPSGIPSDYERPAAPKRHSNPLPPPTPLPDPAISAPVMSSAPLPPMVLLQPTVYDPAAAMSRHTLRPSASHHGGGMGCDASGDGGDGLSPVQRRIEADAEADRRRLLAEDAAARSSALQKAKAAVLAKLSREFSKRRHGGGGRLPGDDGDELAATWTRRGGVGFGNAATASIRLREGLFGAIGIGSGAGHRGVGACGYDSSYALGYGCEMAVRMSSAMSILPDHTSLESSASSALVPLMFSRS